jgi:hypothetical protein
MRENMQYLSFGIWLIVLNIMISSSIHFHVNELVYSSLWPNNTVVYVHHILFIHSSVDGHLGCFYNLAIVNSAAKHMGV